MKSRMKTWICRIVVATAVGVISAPAVFAQEKEGTSPPPSQYEAAKGHHRDYRNSQADMRGLRKDDQGKNRAEMRAEVLEKMKKRLANTDNPKQREFIQERIDRLESNVLQGNKKEGTPPNKDEIKAKVLEKMKKRLANTDDPKQREFIQKRIDRLQSNVTQGNRGVRDRGRGQGKGQGQGGQNRSPQGGPKGNRGW